MSHGVLQAAIIPWHSKITKWKCISDYKKNKCFVRYWRGFHGEEWDYVGGEFEGDIIEDHDDGYRGGLGLFVSDVVYGDFAFAFAFTLHNAEQDSIFHFSF